MREISVRVLGRIEVRSGDTWAPLGGRLAQALALCLASHPAPLRADVILSRLWPDEERTDEHVFNLMSRLRSTLKPAGLDLDKPRNGGGYLLTGQELSLDEVDAFAFRTLVRQAASRSTAGDDDAAAQHLDDAARLWAGPPLAALPDAFVAQHCAHLRDGLETTRVDLIRQVARIALRRGAPYRAARILQDRPVALPLDGHDLTRLGAAHVLEVARRLHDGQPDEAEELLDALRPEPGSDTEAAVVRRAEDLLMLARRSPDSAHRPLAVEAPTPVRAAPRTLLGRERELRVFDEALLAVHRGQPSLMSVRGEPGSGKTRLAEELAARASAGGVPTVLSVKRTNGALQPLQYLAGALWAHCCRDFSAPPVPLPVEERSALRQFVCAVPTEGPDDRTGERLQAQVVAGIGTLCR